MKRIKTLLFMLAAAAFMILLPESASLKAEAAEAKNYAVKFLPDQNKGKGEWRWQEGSEFDEEKGHREMYYLLEQLQEGDKVAVYNESDGNAVLDLGSVKLGVLTICHPKLAIVHTGGISECQILNSSVCSISGDIDHAYVYDVTAVTFTGNVTELEAISTAKDDSFHSVIGCHGEVAHYKAYAEYANRTFHNIYNVQKGKLLVEDGSLKTQDNYYSTTPPAASVPQVTTAPVVNPTAPASGNVYIVKSGDSLSKIARANGLTLAQLVAKNPQIKNINLIYSGQIINL